MTDVPNPNPAKHWAVRRRTMYAAIVLMVLFSIAFMAIGVHNPEALKSMGVLIGWIYGSLAFPIIGYYSNTGIEEFAKNRKM